MVASLKRLEGVKEVHSDDYQPGVGIYTAVFEKPPLIKPSVVAKELGRYKLERLRARITAAVEEKDGVKRAAGYTLVKGEEEDLVGGLKAGAVYALVGVVREDEKGNLSLALSKAQAKD